MDTNEHKNQKIEEAFEGIKTRYEAVFRMFQPRIGSIGYTERNQTCNFCAAFLHNNIGSVAWYEYPFNNQEHVDAVILDPSDDYLYFIEAKRYNKPKQSSAIRDDIERCIKHEAEIRGRIGNEYGKAIQRVFVVVLADIWEEDPIKKHWNKEYWMCWNKEGKQLADREGDLLTDKINKILPSPQYKPCFCYTEFPPVKETYKDKSLGQYKLLCVYAEI